MPNRQAGSNLRATRHFQDKLSVAGHLVGTISHTIKGLQNGLDGGIYLVNTGLGLFIANKIAQAHRGNITIESKVDVGSSLTIKLLRERVIE